jgi:toxin YoeB
MEIVFLPQAKQDLEFWIKSGNKALLKKIAQLTESIILTPNNGVGKPEGLKHQLAGKWSRRISAEHRYIYQVEGNILKVYSLRGHYLKT